MNFQRIKADNRIFKALSQQDWAAWLPHLEPVTWVQGAVVVNASQPVSHVCFPAQGVVSLQAATSPAVKLALIGREGVIGLLPPPHGSVQRYKAVAETAGGGYRLEIGKVQAAMNASSDLLLLLLRYQQALTAQKAQAAVCRRHHTLEQQFCRWLLLGMDWLESPERLAPIDMAAEFVGYRTEDILKVTHSLQAKSLIECAWPRLVVTDREGVVQRCCDCYQTIKREYQIL